MNLTIPIFHPREMSAEKLESMLVGRQELLRSIEESIRQQSMETSRQHWILQGPKGIGKTHLMGVVKSRILRDETLSQVYMPLWLPETEVYSIYSTGTLLSSILEYLLQVFRDEKSILQHPSEYVQRCISQLDEGLAQLEGAGSENTFFREAEELLKNVLETYDLRLVILIENIEALFEGFSKHDRKMEMKRLRSVLQHEQRLFFICTSAKTTPISILSDPEEPLYGLFREEKVHPLTINELTELFHRLETVTEHKALLLDEEERSFRIHIIHRLTGGLPRLTVMMFGIMSGERGLEGLIQSLRRLLDTQTPYFEGQLAAFAPRERAIITALAQEEKNLTQAEIVKHTHLPSRSLSPQLKRLIEAGHIKEVYRSGREVIYQLVDGLFRLWYQYRQGKATLRELVYFLAMWYEPEELNAAVTRVQGSIGSVHTTEVQAQLMSLVLSHLETAKKEAQTPKTKEERKALWEKCQSDFLIVKLNEELPIVLDDPDKAESTIKKVISKLRRAKDKETQKKLEGVAYLHMSIIFSILKQWTQAKDAAKKSQLCIEEFLSTKDNTEQPSFNIQQIYLQNIISLLQTIISYEEGKHEESIVSFESVRPEHSTQIKIPLYIKQPGQKMYIYSLIRLGFLDKAMSYIRKILKEEELAEIERDEYIILLGINAVLTIQPAVLDEICNTYFIDTSTMRTAPFFDIPMDIAFSIFKGISHGLSGFLQKLSFSEKQKQASSKQFEALSEHITHAAKQAQNHCIQHYTVYNAVIYSTLLAIWSYFTPSDTELLDAIHHWRKRLQNETDLSTVFELLIILSKLVRLEKETRRGLPKQEKKKQIEEIRAIGKREDVSKEIKKYHLDIILKNLGEEHPKKEYALLMYTILEAIQKMTFQQLFSLHPLFSVWTGSISLVKMMVILPISKDKAKQDFEDALHWMKKGPPGKTLPFLLLKENMIRNFPIPLLLTIFQKAQLIENHKEIAAHHTKLVNVLQIATELDRQVEEGASQMEVMERYDKIMASIVPEYKQAVGDILRILLEPRGFIFRK